MAAPPNPARPTARRSEASETLRFLLVLALAVFALRSFVLAPFFIPSESMLPRLYVGDFLFVSKWNYGYSRWSLPWGLPLIGGRVLGRLPERGDVVVFRAPEVLDHDVVKRVIGLPGDTVRVRGGQLVLNGRPVPKDRVADLVLPVSPNFSCDPPYREGAECRYQRFRETLPNGRAYAVLDQGDFPDRDDTGVYTVPAGRIFVMGDNRDRSADSRFPAPNGMGLVPVENIEGRALVTFFSTDGSANWLKPWTWLSAARGSRIGETF